MVWLDMRVKRGVSSGAIGRNVNVATVWKTVGSVRLGFDEDLCGGLLRTLGKVFC